MAEYYSQCATFAGKCDFDLLKIALLAPKYGHSFIFLCEVYNKQGGA